MKMREAKLIASPANQMMCLNVMLLVVVPETMVTIVVSPKYGTIEAAKSSPMNKFLFLSNLYLASEVLGTSCISSFASVLVKKARMKNIAERSAANVLETDWAISPLVAKSSLKRYGTMDTQKRRTTFN